MNWLSLFRRLSDFRKRPLSGERRSRPLGLECLENRLVPAAPTIVSVTPATGGTLGDPPLNSPARIEVVFSENVTGADVASNFRLFGSDGTPVNVASVSYNPGTFTSTILASNLSVNGAQLTAGTYSLYLRAAQIIDTDALLPI